MCTSVLWQGHYYGIDGNSHNARLCKLVCLDATTGKRVWEQRGFGCGALMLADGKLLILSDEGYLSIAKATSGGFEELARTRVFDGQTWTMPVLARGRIYCRSESGTVVCLDVSR
jgi:outer membrane protein assembly factor BamB